MDSPEKEENKKTKNIKFDDEKIKEQEEQKKCDPGPRVNFPKNTIRFLTYLENFNKIDENNVFGCKGKYMKYNYDGKYCCVDKPQTKQELFDFVNHILQIMIDKLGVTAFKNGIETVKYIIDLRNSLLSKNEGLEDNIEIPDKYKGDANLYIDSWYQDNLRYQNNLNESKQSAKQSDIESVIESALISAQKNSDINKEELTKLAIEFAEENSKKNENILQEPISSSVLQTKPTKQNGSTKGEPEEVRKSEEKAKEILESILDGVNDNADTPEEKEENKILTDKLTELSKNLSIEFGNLENKDEKDFFVKKMYFFYIRKNMSTLLEDVTNIFVKNPITFLHSSIKKNLIKLLVPCYNVFAKHKIPQDQSLTDNDKEKYKLKNLESTMIKEEIVEKMPKKLFKEFFNKIKSIEKGKPNPNPEVLRQIDDILNDNAEINELTKQTINAILKDKKNSKLLEITKKEVLDDSIYELLSHNYETFDDSIRYMSDILRLFKDIKDNLVTNKLYDTKLSEILDKLQSIINHIQNETKKSRKDENNATANTEMNKEIVKAMKSEKQTDNTPKEQGLIDSFQNIQKIIKDMRASVFPDTTSTDVDKNITLTDVHKNNMLVDIDEIISKLKRLRTRQIEYIRVVKCNLFSFFTPNRSYYFCRNFLRMLILLLQEDIIRKIVEGNRGWLHSGVSISRGISKTVNVVRKGLKGMTKYSTFDNKGDRHTFKKNTKKIIRHIKDLGITNIDENQAFYGGGEDTPFMLGLALITIGIILLAIGSSTHNQSVSTVGLILFLIGIALFGILIQAGTMGGKTRKNRKGKRKHNTRKSHNKNNKNKNKKNKNKKNKK